MPFEGEHQNDIGLTLPEGSVCTFDVENGSMKSPDAIFEGGVSFFADAAAHGDRALAARLTRRNMRSLPYWQAHPFDALSGETATDAEFETAMAAL